MTENPLFYHSLIGAAIVAALYIVSRPVRSIVGFIGRKLFAKTGNVLDDRILEIALANLRPILIVVGLHVAFREIRKGATPADLTVLQVLEYAEALLYIVVVLIVIRLVLGIVREIINWYLENISGEGASNLKLTIGPLANKVIDLVIGLVAVIVILDHFGINIGSLLVSLGVASLAVALAAQDTLANMIAGFVILIDRPFRVGDRIELATGQVGDVAEIGLRSTRVLNFDNNQIVIPNAELVKGRITNYSYPQRSMRVQLRFELDHGTDVDRVREILLGLASAEPSVLNDPPPQVFVTAITESAVQVSLVARCASFGDQYRVETTLREQAYRRFRERGIAMPVLRRIIQMKSDA